MALFDLFLGYDYCLDIFLLWKNISILDLGVSFDEEITVLIVS